MKAINPTNAADFRTLEEARVTFGCGGQSPKIPTAISTGLVKAEVKTVFVMTRHTRSRELTENA